MSEHYHYVGGGRSCTNPNCPDWLPKTREEAERLYGGTANTTKEQAS